MRNRQPRGTARATAGFRLATAIGFIWGFIWSQGAVQRHQGMWVFCGMPSWTYGRAGTCIGACYLTDEDPSPAALRHELIHVEQWRRHGLTFPFRYFRAGLDPHRNRFEIEAGLEDGGYSTLPR